MKSKTKVFVGLSGGVDSAVSAALLKQEGYAVTGVFIKAWTPEGYPCTWKEDRRSAMRVAAILDIPFITLDLEKEYKKEVVDYMVAEYKKGNTPNPDVMCNKEIKFGHFLKFALKNGADFVATGHYAQILFSKQSKKASLPKVLGSPVTRLNQTFVENFFGLLTEGADKNKDQSYFLWTLTPKQLEHILFPIGAFQKPEVRSLAAKFALPQATKKDSQGLCFLGQVDMKEFLGRYVPPKRGNVLNINGEVIGYHNGAIFFTMGERHGFTITKKTSEEVPLYVISKDISKNTITVAPITRNKIANGKVWPNDSEGARGLFQEQFFSGGINIKLQNINWISGKMPDLSKRYLARIRYRQEKEKCVISKQNDLPTQAGGYSVTFDKPQIGVSAGQSLVLYDNEICLGGGIIE